MEPRRYLRCLGQPALFAPTGEPIRFRTKKHLALLVYLAVEARPVHTRDRLAELLWPAGSREEARHSLATALSILRPRVGRGALQTDRERVCLLHGSVELDLDRLAAGEIAGSDVTPPLEVAGFLDGFDIPDAGEFALWKDRQHARLLPAIKDALIVLIDGCRRTGNSRSIERLADQMLALDELSEEAIRAKMEARAFAGDRITALRIFEEWKRKIASELGAMPSAALSSIAFRLQRRGLEDAPSDDLPTVPTDHWRGRPFIGRTAEFRALYEMWERAQRGTPTHAWVTGDSGVGKSTLVGRFLTAAGLEGAAVSRVQCHDLERDIPYALIGNLVLSLVERPGASGTSPEALAEIARPVPEIRQRFPSLPQSSEAQGETARIRLTEAFHQLTRSVAEEHPVVLALDDVHLADEASLTVLHLVLRRVRTERLMMIFTAQPGALAASSHAIKLQHARSLDISEIELQPLAEEDSRTLLLSLLADEQAKPSKSISRALVQAAGGFPMAMELLLQDWQLYGEDSLALAIGAMTSSYREPHRQVTTYQRLLARIIAVLEPRQHHVLSLAAVLGHRLNDIGLYSLLDLSVAQAVAGLSRLTALRVLRDGTTGLEFVNEIVRAHAYASIPAPIRRSLHDSIATALLQPSSRPSPPSGLEIAWHCIRAGRNHEALHHLLRGAREAIAIGAPHEAEQALSSALPSLEGAQRQEATLLLAEVLQEQGCWRESLDCLGGVGVSAKEYDQDILVLTAEAHLNLSTSSAEGIFDRVSELMDIVRHSPRARTRVRAGKVLAILLERHRDETLAAEVLEYVMTIPVGSLDHDAVAELGLARAQLMYYAGQTGHSLDEAQRTVAALEERKCANLNMVHLYSGLGALSSRLGRYDDAVTHFEHAQELAQRLGNDTSVDHLVANLVLCLARLGRYVEQDEWAPRYNQLHGPELTSFAEIQFPYAMSLGLAMRNHPQRALDTVNSLQGRLIGRIPAWMRQAWSLWRADILLLCGRRADAIGSAWETVGGDAPVLYSQAFAGPFCQWLSMTATTDTCERGLAVVSKHSKCLEHYDAIDQAQILCARYRLEGMLGQADQPTLRQLSRCLLVLPRAVWTQLAALEMLPLSLNTASTPYPG